MRKKYLAYISCMDNDYRRAVYNKDTVLEVSTWQEALQYCAQNTWSGESYFLDKLTTLDKKVTFNNYSDWEKFNSRTTIRRSPEYKKKFSDAGKLLAQKMNEIR